MTKGKQGSRRAHKRIEVRYGLDEPRFIGYSGNLSKSGIMVRAVRVFPPGSVLNLDLRLPGGTVRVCGVVVWAREGPPQWVTTGRIGMGITFIESPPELLAHLDR
jgi:uncharacterized protein (TIGR02266 family)